MISNGSTPLVTKPASLSRLLKERLLRMVQVRLVMLSISQSLVLSITAVPGLPASRARPQRNKNTGLQEILAAERLDKWGDVDKKHCQPK